jgi:N-acetylneuraminic acid mutarotase
MSCSSGSPVCVDTGTFAHDCWAAISSSNAPTGRYQHAVAWTGTQMIVWGGADASGTGVTNTGGVYDVAADTWQATWPIGAPPGTWLSMGFWFSGKMMIVAGLSLNGYNHGAITYDPALYQWSGMGAAGLGSVYAAGVVTPGGVIYCGGTAGAQVQNIGWLFPNYTTSGMAIADGVPANGGCRRSNHTAVWSGTEMLVYGGLASNSPQIPASGGSRYLQASDSWKALSPEQPPTYPFRWDHVSVWTGSRMIVWGGNMGADGVTYAPTAAGGSYDPATDSWTKLSTVGAPEARTGAIAVWTGAKMLVYGGVDENGNLPLNTGAAYDPIQDKWAPIAVPPWPRGRIDHTAVWTGVGMIVYGGQNPNYHEVYGDGAIYYP